MDQWPKQGGYTGGYASNLPPPQAAPVHTCQTRLVAQIAAKLGIVVELRLATGDEIPADCEPVRLYCPCGQEYWMKVVRDDGTSG